MLNTEIVGRLIECGYKVKWLDITKRERCSYAHRTNRNNDEDCEDESYEQINLNRKSKDFKTIRITMVRGTEEIQIDEEYDNYSDFGEDIMLLGKMMKTHGEQLRIKT